MSGGEMPTYRYRCTDCGEEFERWQSIIDNPLRTHDDGCGGEILKVLTPAGIVLKGSGFYKNDSRSSDGTRDRTDGSKTKDGGGPSESTAAPSDTGSGVKEGAKESGSTAKPDGSSTKKSGDSKSTASAAKPT